MEVVEDQDDAVFGDCRQLPQVGVQDRVSGRTRDAGVGEQAGGPRREFMVVFAAGGDQMVHDRDPVAVVLVEAVPQRSQARSCREIGQQRRLAVARLRED